jgi:hypothetical protein
VPGNVASASGATAMAAASSRTARASARDMSSVNCWLAKLVGGFISCVARTGRWWTPARGGGGGCG